MRIKIKRLAQGCTSLSLSKKPFAPLRPFYARLCKTGLSPVLSPAVGIKIGRRNDLRLSEKVGARRQTAYAV